MGCVREISDSFQRLPSSACGLNSEVGLRQSGQLSTTRDRIETCDLDKSNVAELHQAAMRVSRQYLRCEMQLLDILERLDRKRGFLEFGAASLYQYCVETLGLSEAVSYNLICVMRKAREVPEMKVAIRKGEITVSKARKIVSVITKSNQSEWLTLAAMSTSRQIEKAVAKENPQTLERESLRYRTETLLELTLGVSEEWAETLARLKDLLSQKEACAVRVKRRCLSR